MPRSERPTVSLEEVKARFEEWRRNRTGKTPIPDELWAAAAEVARKEGVSRASTELRIEWNHLKRRMAAVSGGIVETGLTEVRGTGRAARGVAARMRDRTGRPFRCSTRMAGFCA